MNSRLLTGALEMLILDVLSRGDNYGYQLAQFVGRGSKGYFQLKEGSLYPALHRLERQKLVRAFWIDSDEGRRRKYYRLTAKGRRAHTQRRADWQQFSTAVDGVLGADYAMG